MGRSRAASRIDCSSIVAACDAEHSGAVDASTALEPAAAARGRSGVCDGDGDVNQPARAVAPVTTVAAAFQFTCITQLS